MSCTIEVYDVVRHRDPATYTSVHTNLGYTHFHMINTISGLLNCISWQWHLATEKERRKRYDSWLRDGPPECEESK